MVATPCIKVCELDANSGLCRGCGRTLAEIGGWLSFSEAERAALMAALPARMAGAGLTAAPAAHAVPTSGR